MLPGGRRDLLIIDCMEIRPRWRGMGLGPAAVDRTIDIFGPGGGLVACKPWPLQFTPAFARAQKASKRLKAPGVGRDEAVGKLRAYWSRIGFLAARGDRDSSPGCGPKRIKWIT